MSKCQLTAIRKRQSRIIFVAKRVDKSGKGASHRNINNDNINNNNKDLYFGALHLMGALIYMHSTNINGATHLKNACSKYPYKAL